MLKKKPSVISIVLFAISALLLAYSVWSIVTARSIIGEAIAAGQITIKDSLYEIVNYYMSSTAVYVLFAILFAVIGWQSFKTVQADPAVSALATEESTDEDSTDEENADGDSAEAESKEESDIQSQSTDASGDPDEVAVGEIAEDADTEILMTRD